MCVLALTRELAEFADAHDLGPIATVHIGDLAELGIDENLPDKTTVLARWVDVLDRIDHTLHTPSMRLNVRGWLDWLPVVVHTRYPHHKALIQPALNQPTAALLRHIATAPQRTESG
ncbi:hypothetical protein EV191_101921 [Tamaricihabitans halophyticus]|uniref:Uncharacterized protein n=1 Tax=Tamaricihabitans halophyticus TaxID=1262583 RepID=A0A4R2RB89_9PSEU|nr:hypothetical protein [Tamaricihabitans halophyticus]TCP56971.1 hypothetical protein EV191_101921 [Tamaricihabitans halophyticus]